MTRKEKRQTVRLERGLKIASRELWNAGFTGVGLRCSDKTWQLLGLLANPRVGAKRGSTLRVVVYVTDFGALKIRRDSGRVGKNAAILIAE